ncbi:hypothetical protein NDU88_005012 [Pleurodeles waltl]|uniref:Uncharacterized protein n=1 Tax=Pleurodeles waltl TaxID=8319 RepID=A0AAV7MBL6_PLEWA|nr:hypothetical protein NDU88_005012 [Pleurodeles waltl]
MKEPILIVSDSDGDDPLGNFSKKGVMSELESVGRSENKILVQWVPRLVSPMLHKVQHWDVENRTLIQTGQFVEVMNKCECTVAGVAFDEAELGDSWGGVQVGEDFGNPVCDHGVPGCGKALASSGQEQHMSEAGQGRPAFTSGHMVGVITPLRHLEEERVRPGAAHPTSGDAFLSSQVWKRHIAYDEPSTSQSASGLTQDIGFEECLDFDEGHKTVVLVGGLQRDLGGQGNNKSWSFVVLQGQRKATVWSDRRDDERSASGSAGNLSRGEERTFNSGFKGWGLMGLGSAGGKARVQDMGVQTCSSSNDVVISKVGDSEVSVSSNKAEPVRLA